MIRYLRASGLTLAYDPNERTLRVGTESPAAVTLDRKH